MKLALVLGYTLTLFGCASSAGARAAASAHSGCPGPRIKTIDEGWTGVVLDVCGKPQLWLLGMDGRYEYVGDAPHTAKVAR